MAQLKEKDIAIIAGIGLGAWILYKPFKALFDTLGITQSQTAQAVEQIQTQAIKSPFNPSYWKSFPKAFLMTQVQADAKATAIYNSITYFGNDFPKILAIFKTIGYKTQVSQLSEVFSKKFNIDLLEYLKNGKSNFLVHNALNETQLQTIISLVNNLK